MNIPAAELQAFLEEYAHLAFPERRVLRADYFYHKEDHHWLTVFLAEQQGRSLLCDAAGQLLCEYDRITPLFTASAVTDNRDVAYLLEQLSGLRSRISREQYEQARAGLEALTQPADPFAPAYLVWQEGSAGVVSPDGNLIVPVQYAQIRPFALTTPGDATLFLCRKSGHLLNGMDVYDINGNCILRQISDFYPREQSLLTAADSGMAHRTVKSLWVIRQSVDHPFPEDPEFQLVAQTRHRYTRRQLGITQDCPVWSCLPDGSAPPAEALLPLAQRIGEAIGHPCETVLQRLADYRAFRRECMPLSVRLSHVTPETPLDQLGFSVRAYHCLARRRLQTAADLLRLTDDDIAQLYHSTDSIIDEIRSVHSAIAQRLQ